MASERVPLMTVFEVESEQVQELPPANMLSIKADGTHAITEFTTPLKPAPCSFEKIYFSAETILSFTGNAKLSVRH